MFDTITEIKATQPFFFSAENMRFFGSRIIAAIWFKPYEGERYFVSEEDNFDRSQKRYTIRRFNPDTLEIDTLGDFQQYATLAEAEADLREGGFTR